MFHQKVPSSAPGLVHSSQGTCENKVNNIFVQSVVQICAVNSPTSLLHHLIITLHSHAVKIMIITTSNLIYSKRPGESSVVTGISEEYLEITDSEIKNIYQSAHSLIMS